MFASTAVNKTRKLPETNDLAYFAAKPTKEKKVY